MRWERSKNVSQRDQWKRSSPWKKRLQRIEGQQKEPSARKKRGGSSSARLRLGDEASQGREQAGIDGAGPLERLGIDGDVDRRIEPTHRAHVARLRSLDAKVFGLAIDAFARGALIVDGMEERTVPIKHESHEASFLQVAVFDTALAFEELLMSTALARVCRKEQGTAKTLGAIAIGMRKLVGAAEQRGVPSGSRGTSS